MHHIIGLLFTTASFIVVISVLVFVHEFGHYIIAKWAGVKIEVFSIGFGQEIRGWTDKSGTRWKIGALPLGGYVKMYGDASEASTPLSAIDALPEDEKKKTFYHKSLPKKAAIVVAGPLANFLLTIFIFTIFITLDGLPSTEPIVGEIVKGSAAEAAGLLPDDRILAVDNQTVETFNDIPRIILTNLGTPVTLKLQRTGQELRVTLTPKMVTDKDQLGNPYTHPLIGISSKKIKIEEVGLLRAIGESILRTYHFCTVNLEAIWQIATGHRSFSGSITGPIGMARMSGQAAEKGPATLFIFMANISASLGLVNLFPILPLDGGHLFYYALEAVRGRPLARNFQEYGFRIGTALIVILMASAILSDIHKWLLTLAHG